MSVWDNAGNARKGSAPNIHITPPRGLDGRFQSGPAAFQWTGLDRLVSSYADMADQIDHQRQEGAQRLASDALAYMKANAPWKDRTGQARSTLMATVVDDEDAHTSTVFLGYGVFYGPLLENKTYRGRSYAIIRPTVSYFKDKVASYLK